MDGKVLVAYGTKYGATTEIAGKIGEVLRQQGLDADVVAAGQAGDLAPYGAFVIGSGAYFGRWRKEAVKFLKKNEALLAEKPVWLFSSGPTGEGDPVELAKGWQHPKALQPSIDQIQPRGIALFHGKVDPEKLGALERTAIKKVEAPTGVFRKRQPEAVIHTCCGSNTSSDEALSMESGVTFGSNCSSQLEPFQARTTPLDINQA